MNRADLYAARHAQRAYDRAAWDHAQDQRYADFTMPFRDPTPPLYWTMLSFRRCADPLLCAKSRRIHRLNAIREQRALLARREADVARFEANRPRTPLFDAMAQMEREALEGLRARVAFSMQPSAQ